MSNREENEELFGKEITDIMYEKLGEPAEVLHVGGGNMVGVWELHDGTILTLNSEVIVHHRDLEEFWMEDGEYKDIDSFSFWDGVNYNSEWSDVMTARAAAWVDSAIEG